MRLSALALVILLAGATTVSALTPRPSHAQGATPAAPAGPPPAPPRVFLAAGYAQPDITPGYCKNINASQTQCTVPEMTAGTYYVEAVGSSTAAAAGAAQQMAVVAGDQTCTATRRPDPKAPWQVGVKRSLRAGCLFTIVTDVPISITAVYVDANATKDPKGPLLSVRRAPWSGVLRAEPVPLKQ